MERPENGRPSGDLHRPLPVLYEGAEGTGQRRFLKDPERRASLDGLGDDWPITYDDIKPYYDKLDEFVGIFGTNHAAQTGLHNEPDGKFQPPPLPRAYELYFKQAADRLKIACVPSRLSILTRPLNGRAACHYCAQCGRGCSTHSNFQSSTVLIPPALATKKLTIIAGAMAREVLSNAEGLATGVSYRELASRFDIPETQVTNHLAAMRRRFRELVLEVLREVTATDEEFRNESRALLGGPR